MIHCLCNLNCDKRRLDFLELLEQDSLMDPVTGLEMQTSKQAASNLG